jgi:hypothetical protein
VSAETRARTEAILRQHPMGATGSSDAHELEVVGCYFTEVLEPIASMSDFVAALKARRVRPRHRRGARLACGPVS